MGLKKDLQQVYHESPWLLWVLLLVCLLVMVCLVLDQVLQVQASLPEINWSNITQVYS